MGGLPDLAAHYQNRVNAWFDTDRSADGIFEDHQLLTRYCAHIGVAAEDYNTLFNRAMSDKLQAHEIFAEYRKIFAGDTKAKNIKKKQYQILLFNNYSPAATPVISPFAPGKST